MRYQPEFNRISIDSICLLVNAVLQSLSLYLRWLFQTKTPFHCKFLWRHHQRRYSMSNFPRIDMVYDDAEGRESLSLWRQKRLKLFGKWLQNRVRTIGVRNSAVCALLFYENFRMWHLSFQTVLFSFCLFIQLYLYIHFVYSSLFA